MYRAIY
ncbi:hypothetical protein VCHC50A2_1851A, partial [Vibrio cholerae HC-50A2]